MDVVLEPLATSMRNPCFHGVKSGNLESLINLCTDDMLLCLSDPAIQNPSDINSLIKLSGYTINEEHIEFMPLKPFKFSYLVILLDLGSPSIYRSSILLKWWTS